jgi:hypothetical protein
VPCLLLPAVVFQCWAIMRVRYRCSPGGNAVSTPDVRA